MDSGLVEVSRGEQMALQEPTQSGISPSILEYTKANAPHGGRGPSVLHTPLSGLQTDFSNDPYVNNPYARTGRGRASVRVTMRVRKREGQGE